MPTRGKGNPMDKVDVGREDVLLLKVTTCGGCAVAIAAVALGSGFQNEFKRGESPGSGEFPAAVFGNAETATEREVLACC